MKIISHLTKRELSSEIAVDIVVVNDIQTSPTSGC